MARDADKVVPVGRVTGVYGVRGWLRLRSDTMPPQVILDYDTWLLRVDGCWEARRPLEGRIHGPGVVAHIDGIDARESARLLVGADIAVRRHELPDLAPNEYYWTDLVGLEVRGSSGEVLGTVVELIETGANDVLVVRGETEMLIPYLPDRVVKRVDLGDRVIEVEWDPDY